MHRLVPFVAAFALLAAPALAAPVTQPPAAIATLAHAIVGAANANDASKLRGIYTDDAVVIDEDPPFVWRGANAGVMWWRSVAKIIATKHATLHAAGLPFTEYRVDGDDAYLIQPMRIEKSAGGHTMVERGMQTYTFHRARGVWKISSAVWTTTP